MDKAGSPRDLGLTAARGLAVLLIIVAQTAPGAGPFHVLTLSAFLPPPLLATLIGLTAQTARERGAPWHVFMLWGVALFALGAALSVVPSQVLGIPVYLGALVVLTTALVRLPRAGQVVVVAALLAVEPWLKGVADRWHARHHMSLHATWGGRRLLDLVDLVAGSPSYRLTALVVFACVGMLLVRLVHTPGEHGSVAGGAAVLALMVYAVEQVGGPQLHPYSGALQVLLFNGCAAVAVAEAGRWLGTRKAAVTELLADIGGMWLTLDVLLVLGTAIYLQTGTANGRDDSWAVMIALLLGSVVLASAWVRLFAGTRFEQGPIEGALETLAGQAPTLRTASMTRVDRERIAPA